MTFMRKIMELMTLNTGINDKENAANETIDKPPLIDPYELPRSIEEFKDYHYRILRRLAKKPKGSHLSGLNSLQVRFDKFVPLLFEMGLLRLSTYEESIENLTLQKLRDTSKKLGLKVSGRKQELINRIISESSEECVRNIIKNLDIYILTDLGKEILNNSIVIIEAKENVFFKTVIDYILSYNFNIAHDIICKKNAEMPFPPGLGVNWAKRYYNGINKYDTDIFISRMNSSDDKLCTACVIYSEMSGEPITAVIQQANKLPVEYENQDIELRIRNERYQCDVKKAELTIRSHDKNDKYIFVGTLDTRSCPYCGCLDRHKYTYGEAKVGINYPPMHQGCRCTTISDISLEELARMKRWARDPVTGKTMYVPADMTYEEWYKKYVK